jgi:hypothetical protein
MRSILLGKIMGELIQFLSSNLHQTTDETWKNQSKFAKIMQKNLF